MADFKKAYNKTMVIEGHYANDPNDRGGETWKGIARRSNGDWNGWDIIDRLKKEPGFPRSLQGNVELEKRVQERYKQNYWDPMWLDKCPDDFQPIADEMFDTGVHMGIGWATRFLQRALNALNQRATLYPDIEVDSSYGPATHRALMGFYNNVQKDRHVLLFILMNALQGSRYLDLTEAREINEIYMHGWLTRVQGREGWDV